MLCGCRLRAQLNTTPSIRKCKVKDFKRCLPRDVDREYLFGEFFFVVEIFGSNVPTHSVPEAGESVSQDIPMLVGGPKKG